MSWGPGKTIINLYILDHELEPLQEQKLGPKDVLDMIKTKPCLIPFIKTNNYYIIENMVIENRKIDLIIAEARGKSNIVLHLVLLKWFKYGSRAEKYGSPGDLYEEIGFDIEMLDELIDHLLYLGTCRKKWARELKNKLKKAFSIKRIVIANVYTYIVVDKLTNKFIQIIDSINDLIDPYIDALSITAYKHQDHDRIALVSLYTWREHVQ